MFNVRRIKEDIFYVGANDRRLEKFENMFQVPEGVSYNSYVIIDEKTAVLDTIDASSVDVYMENVDYALQGRDLDYLILHHVEPDHCAGILELCKKYPNVTLLGTKKAIDLVGQFYPFEHQDRCRPVADGEELSLGKRTLRFIAAPMVHWPEVMMSYEVSEKILFSADAFGSFKAISGHLFADQVNYERDWMDEARRYYINIVGRQGASVIRLLKKVESFPIEMICPLHGLVFRTQDKIQEILAKYITWASYEPEEKGITLVYGSMYNNSALLADYLGGLLAEAGVPNIRIHDVSKSEISEMIADVFRYSNAAFICNNYNTELYPKMDALLRELMMLNYDNRKVSILYNMSWGGKAADIAKEILASGKKIEYVGDVFKIMSSLKPEQKEELEAFAKMIADSMA